MMHETCGFEPGMDTTEQRQTGWAFPFFSIWTGQAFSLMGSNVAGFALVWWLTESTGSATILATATMVTFLPHVFLSPFAGVFVDRWNRRLVMIIADSAIAMVSAWLAYLFWTGSIQIWHVYVIALVRAIGGAFHFPAMQASTSLMVPKQHLSRVAGLNQTMNGALNIVGPPLGAILLGILPLHAIMAIDVVTAAVAITPLFFVSIPQPQHHSGAIETEGEKPSLWADLREGLSYVWHWRGLFTICIMAMLMNFLAAPAFVLTPILVTKHFRGEALELGWMNSAWGIGLVLGGLILSTWGGFRRRILTTLTGAIGMGLGTLITGLSPTSAFSLALGGMFFAGMMNSICNGSIIAIFQAVIAPEMQGRVFTLTGSLTSGMMPLSMVVAGPVADAFGVSIWYVMSGIFSVLVCIVGFFVPAVMHLEETAPKKQDI